jgi:hypothetical protein
MNSKDGGICGLANLTLKPAKANDLNVLIDIKWYNACHDADEFFQTARHIIS